MALASVGAQPPPALPTPSEFLKINIGADGVLADYEQIVAYWKAIDAKSDRITVQELGKTTMGRPYVAAIITSPDNQRRLEEYRTINNRLYDPRKTSESEAKTLISAGKTIVAIQMGIHSDEVGAPQLSLELAYRFATENTLRMKEVLDNTIIILSPSHNPDGAQMVAEWNRKTLGTAYEGGMVPFLYHPYVGHDNNRDWYMFTQKETQLTVEKIWNAWHPQISYDLHQMGIDGARIFVPPYIEPVDPNIDPLLLRQTGALGTAMARELASHGRQGVVSRAIYDLWTPARAYVNYHGGVRVLTEVASARLASPVTLSMSQLGGGIGYDAKQASANFPRPWQGGTWRLRDILDYEHAALDALLDHAAAERGVWLETFWRVNKNAVGSVAATDSAPRPFAIVIPASQRDPMAALEMLRALQRGDVEIHRARNAFSADGVRYPRGSHVILTAQPASAFARTLTDVQHYPDVRSDPRLPPQEAYDGTAYTLPLLMGVSTARAMKPFAADLELISMGMVSSPAATLGDDRPRVSPSVPAYALAHDSAGIRALIELARDRLPVSWALEPFTDGRVFPAGTLTVPAGPGSSVQQRLASMAQALPLTMYPLTQSVARDGGRDNGRPANISTARMTAVRLPRVALYKSPVPNLDEGWTRWILEQWGMPYSSIGNGDIRSGNILLQSRFDVLVLPDQSSNEIVNGLGKSQVPEEYAGGIGREGVAALGAFVRDGGTLVAIQSAALFAAQQFDLPVDNVIAGRSTAEFYAPGSILGTQVDIGHPVGSGAASQSIAWFDQSPAFQVRPPARAVVSYRSEGSPLLSGWLIGGERLKGAAAVVEVPMGRGRVILFGFRPQYRAQTWATFGLFFNSLFYSTMTQESNEQ